MRSFAAACVCLVLTTSAARADEPPAGTIALLPLDADKRLEVYGQPVAAELGRALRAVHVVVVVVGAGMTVPERARLVVRGKIVAGKTDSIALSVQVSDPKSGEVLDALSSSAASETAIDRAAADLATRVVAAVQKRLAVRKSDAILRPIDTAHRPEPQPAPRPLQLLYTVTGPAGDALVAALPDALGAWAAAHKRSLATGSTDALASPRDLAIVLDVVELRVEDVRGVPSARAKVRVRIAKRDDKDVAALWNRVVVTDTVVGDKGMATAALAARVAREVLAIVQPHAHRVVSTW